MKTEELVESLRREGRLAKSGDMELDQDRARRKLQKFQLPDPHAYVLQFVEAAHLLGATRIEIEVDADEVEVRFDGRPIDREPLASIYASAFRDRRDDRAEALRHLAIGLIAAQEVDPAVVRVETAPDDGTGTALVVDGRGELSVEDHPGPEEATTRIYLRETLRAAHIPRFFHKYRGELTEQTLVRDACRLTSIPVVLNGDDVTDGSDPRGDLAADLAFETDEERGSIGIQQPDRIEVAARRRTGRAWLVQNGVLQSVCRFGQRLKPARPLAVVETDRLRKNLSQTAFVEDEAWRRLTGEILPELAFDALHKLVADWGLEEVRAYRRWLELLFWSVTSEVAGGEPRTGAVRLAERLAEFPILPLAIPVSSGERTVEIDGVVHVPPAVEMRSGGAAQYATRRFPPSDRGSDDVVLLAASGRTASALESLGDGLFGGVRDVTERLRAEQQRRFNRQRWSERPRYELSSTSKPGRSLRAEEGAFECLLSVFAADGDHSMHVLREGRLLEALSLDALPMPKGVSVISGPTEPNERWSGVARTRPLRRALYRMLEMIPLGIARAASLHMSRRDAVPRWLPRALKLLVGGTFAETYFEAVGIGRERVRGEFPAWVSEATDRTFEDSVWSLDVSLPVTDVPAPAEFVRKLDALADIEVFRMLPGEPVSIEELFGFLEAHGRIAYIVDDEESAWWTEEARDGRSSELVEKYEMGRWEEPIVVVDAAERDLLWSLTGDRAEAVETEFEQRAGAALKVRETPPISLPAEKYAIDRTVTGSNWTAQIGFRPSAGEPRDGATWADGGLRLELTYEWRPISSETLRFPVGRVRALVDSDAWTMNASVTSVQRDDFYREVEESVRREAEDLVVEFAEELAGDLGERPGWRATVVWRLIANTSDEGPFARLRELAVFPVVDGAPVSHRKLRRSLREHGNIRFVVVPEVGGVEGDDREAPVVRVPAETAAQEVFADLFGGDRLLRVETDASDASSAGGAREAFLGRMKVPPRLRHFRELQDSERVRLAEAKFEPGGVAGEVAVYTPRLGRERGLVEYVVLHRSRRLDTGRFEVPFGAGSAVVEADFVEPNETYDGLAAGRRRLELQIRRGLARSIRALSSRIDGNDFDQLRRGRRAVLAWLAELADEESLLDAVWGQVVEELHSCRAFPLVRGPTIDLSELRERVEKAGGRLDLVGPQARPTARSEADEDVPMLRAGAIEGDAAELAESLWRLLDLSRLELRTSGDGRGDASTPFRGTESRQLPPSREVVEEALQEELGRLSDAIDSVALSLPEDLIIAPTRAAWLEVPTGEEQSPRIDPGHEAVQYAEASVREGGSVDPVALAMLVSSVYTAITDQFGAETDVESVAFHTSHAGRVADLLERSTGNDQEEP